jgi:two-component system NtrC family response regulator
LKKILVVDDEKQVCKFFNHLLKKSGYNVTTVQSGETAIELVERDSFDLVLLDLKLPDVDGLTILKHIKEKSRQGEVIMMTGYSTVKSALMAMQLGALDYIEKPFDDLEELERLINTALQKKTKVDELDLRQTANELGLVLGKNSKMLQVIDLARKIAGKNVTVLIQGETGTGKEVMARFVHRCSKRANNAFFPINCAALSETLLESELFGYEKGAFTGANRVRKGYFELVCDGTLFLDEIGEASSAIQAKLLRVLETGEYIRVGGEDVRKSESRIIAASNVFLEEAVKKGLFRQDLFYRLDVVTLKIPPLRERKEDIPVLLEHFLNRYTEGKEVATKSFASETMDVLCTYSWPGNVRELVNVVQQLATMVDEPQIRLRHLPDKILKLHNFSWNNATQNITPPIQKENQVDINREVRFWLDSLEQQLQEGKQIDLLKILEDINETRKKVAIILIERALAKTLGDRKAAARLLNITSRSLKYLYSGK